MLGLLELQHAFAAGLRGAPHDADAWAASDRVPAEARLSLYRINARTVFEQALAATYAVVRERVGDDYFRQLVHFYRRAHPSRSGDLHEVGRRFPEFLSSHLAGTPYSWLAELAALEWAVAEAGVAPDAAVASLRSLSGVPPAAVAGVRLRLVPSLRLLSASVPVLTVWRANQGDSARPVVDLDAGPEFVQVHRSAAGVQLRGAQAAEFAFVIAIARGESIEAAIDESGLPVDRLAPVLRDLFEHEAVAEVVAPAAAPMPSQGCTGHPT